MVQLSDDSLVRWKVLLLEYWMVGSMAAPKAANSV
jgi:hypothetical protein